MPLVRGWCRRRGCREHRRGEDGGCSGARTDAQRHGHNIATGIRRRHEVRGVDRLGEMRDGKRETVLGQKREAVLGQLMVRVPFATARCFTLLALLCV